MWWKRRYWAVVLIAVIIAVAVGAIYMVREWYLHLPLYSSCQHRLARLEQRVAGVPRLSCLFTSHTDQPIQQIPLGVETVHIQVQYARYRLQQLRKANPLRLGKFQLELGRLESDLRSLQKGKDPFRRRKGIILRAHYSEIDGTLQPFSLYVPRGYDGRRPYPLIVYLHAHGWFRPFQGHPAPRLADALVLSPHGRGSTDYMFIGEHDVLAALATVKRVYNVDERRVYLMGHSMGATGCWHLAVHHPGLFAAIAPTAGNTDHTVWEQIWGWSDTSSASLQPLRRRLEKALDPITFAVNLKDVPVFCAHGADDKIVPVEHSRNMVRKLRELGCTVRYEEYPAVGHANLPASLRERQVKWLLEQRKKAQPAAAVLRREDILEWEKGRKPALTGPIEAAFLTPFIVVYGTRGKSALENLICRREAEQFVHEWKRRYGAPCRVKPDSEVTEMEKSGYSLILYGNPSQNSVLAQLSGFLPIKFRGREIIMESQGFTSSVTCAGEHETAPACLHGKRVLACGEDAGVQFCYPNPRNPARYIVVFAGVTWKGLFQINGRFGNWFRWGAYDNRKWCDFAAFDSHSIDPDGMVSFGFFDRRWCFHEQTFWRGDESLRARLVPHQPPIYLEPPTSQRSFALSDLMPVEIDQQKGTVELNRSTRARPLHIGNRKFLKGLGVRPPSRIAYDLGGNWSRLQATVGLDAEGELVSAARREAEKVVFVVKGDGKKLAESPDIGWDDQSFTFDVCIRGVKKLELITEPRDWHLWLFGSSTWGDVEVIR